VKVSNANAIMTWYVLSIWAVSHWTLACCSTKDIAQCLWM
jgi:hypothetical protein